MEERIPYRKLRNLKLKKVDGISNKLLKLPAHRQTSQTRDKDFDITNKNVSMYEYMLVNSYIKENYINWAINLRTSTNSKNNGQTSITDCEPPQTFFKDTQINKIRRGLRQKDKALNISDFSQYLGRSKSSKNFSSTSKQQINYINNLRNYEQQKNSNHSRFNNDAGKSSQLESKILKKSALKKMKGIQQFDKENSLDGTHNFPAYNYKNLRQKNIAMLNLLVKKGDKISLPTLQWSVGLRNYSQLKKQ